MSPTWMCLGGKVVVVVVVVGWGGDGLDARVLCDWVRVPPATSCGEAGQAAGLD